jgi:hypothetical protein
MQNGAQITEGAAPPVDTIANGDRSLQTLLTRQLQEDLGGAGFPNGDRGGTLLCICDFSGAHRSALFNPKSLSLRNAALRKSLLS